ncbi:MAG: phosphate-starvation-inducible PsiE family protein [Acidihalobacter sp.]|jgi:uncharacterized membrane protein (DUF373 family)|uniref:phosphate-starvation-inducible PsiE family protein n=1 Tax=Acidihalobacter sp. TaxID=1872108 RepID=UPI00307DDDEF
MHTHWFEAVMEAANRLLHAFIAIALLVASLLLIWQFTSDVFTSITSGDIGDGFLRSLGNLFILWVLSSLISAEVRYMRTGHFTVVVFIEAALITLLRQLIIIPVESSGHLEQWAWTYGLVIAAVLAVGITYFLVQRLQPSADE